MVFLFLDAAPEAQKTELQNRILNILENKLHDPNKPAGLLPPTQQLNPSILNDSSLQAVKDIVQSKLRGQMNLLGPHAPRI